MAGFKGKFIDVSEHQGVIDWARAKADGVTHAYIRLSMGRTGVDSKAFVNALGCIANGIRWGWYHLLRPEHSGLQQALNFISLSVKAADADLPPAVDVELPVTSTQLDDFLASLPREGVIYTSASKFNALDTEHDATLAQYDLWVAHYGVDRPTLPRLWTRYWLWQHSDNGTVDGITTRVDLNRLEEAMESFKLVYPVMEPVTVAQRFGDNKTGVPTFYTRHGLPAHEGTDFDGELGDPVFAAADGEVLKISLDPSHAYGIHVKLSHRDGEFETDYCHLKKPTGDLVVGKKVSAGELIGYLGNTGNVVKTNSDGSHLHFMLRKRGATAAGERQLLANGLYATYKNDIVDPTPYFDA